MFPPLWFISMYPHPHPLPRNNRPSATFTFFRGFEVCIGVWSTYRRKLPSHPIFFTLNLILPFFAIALMSEVFLPRLFPLSFLLGCLFASFSLHPSFPFVWPPFPPLCLLKRTPLPRRWLFPGAFLFFPFFLLFSTASHPFFENADKNAI